MRHWLVLSLGLAVAAAAAYALLSSSERPAASGPALDRIDGDSRDRLESVLRKEGTAEAR